jgi:hypothetical protein
VTADADVRLAWPLPPQAVDAKPNLCWAIARFFLRDARLRVVGTGSFSVEATDAGKGCWHRQFLGRSDRRRQRPCREDTPESGFFHAPSDVLVTPETWIAIGTCAGVAVTFCIPFAIWFQRIDRLANRSEVKIDQLVEAFRGFKEESQRDRRELRSDLRVLDQKLTHHGLCITCLKVRAGLGSKPGQPQWPNEPMYGGGPESDDD